MWRARLLLAGWVASLVAVAVLASVVAYRIGTGRPSVTWTRGTAYSAPDAISAQADGTSYDIPTRVEWTDPIGSVHTGTRPACLPPDLKTHPVSFAWVPISTAQSDWRQVVSVRC